MSENSLTVGSYRTGPHPPGDDKYTPMHVHTLVRGLWFMKSKHRVTSAYRGRAKATAKLEVRGKDAIASSQPAPNKHPLCV